LRVAVVLGTRPEIIKMSPIIRELKRRQLDFFIIHTGQHYEYEMNGSFFKDLELPKPDFNLGVGSGSHAEQTAKIMVGVEKVLVEEEPDVTLVEGDTNTVAGGALVASKLHLKLGHVEAGLRSGDMRMPEEINRIVADHVSDHLFAPTETSRGNLLREGIDKGKIFVTGNTVVDAAKQNLKLSMRRDFPSELGVGPGTYFLATLHRAENVDDRAVFKGLLAALRDSQREFSLPVIFPVHPRTQKMINEYGLSTEGITAINPIGYLEFLLLESMARLVLTDSGGVQEEACCLGVPCVTLRENTERPEAIEVGANVVAGRRPKKILASARKMLEAKRGWANPYGDGTAAVQIVDILRGIYG